MFFLVLLPVRGRVFLLLIEFRAAHLQAVCDGEECAKDGQHESNYEYCDCGICHILLCDVAEHFFVVGCCPIDSCKEGCVGYDCGGYAHPECLYEERASYKTPSCAYEFHCVEQEAVVIYAQPYCVVDEAQRYDD